MALIRCPECKTSISDQAAACPKCGFQLTAEKKELIRQDQQRQVRKQRLGCLSLIGIVLLIFIISHFSSGGGEGNQNSSSAWGSKTGAWVATQDFVTRRLKDPADASFGSLMHDFQKTDDVVSDLGNGKYHVHAWVDAKNSFGGTIRTRFNADLHYTSDGTWHLDKLDLDE
jgi:hypothetical protein